MTQSTGAAGTGVAGILVVGILVVGIWVVGIGVVGIWVVGTWVVGAAVGREAETTGLVGARLAAGRSIGATVTVKSFLWMWPEAECSTVTVTTASPRCSGRMEKVKSRSSLCPRTGEITGRSRRDGFEEAALMTRRVGFCKLPPLMPESLIVC
jgi:hypothetical protein